MKPRIIQKMSNAEYHANEGISKSGLDLINRSPFIYKQSLEIKREPTKAMQFGTWFHDMLLNPDCKLISEPALEEKETRRSKPWCARRDLLLENNLIENLVPASDYIDLTNMVNAVGNNNLAKEFLKTGQPEISLFWFDEFYGVPCKCRPDWLDIENNRIIEIKTIADAGKFERQAVDFRYHVQQAWYQWGIRQVFGTNYSYYFIAVEKENPAPEKVRILTYSDDSRIVAETEMINNLDLYSKCYKENKWPGYKSELEIIELPEWKKRRVEDGF